MADLLYGLFLFGGVFMDGTKRRKAVMLIKEFGCNFSEAGRVLGVSGQSVRTWTGIKVGRGKGRRQDVFTVLGKTFFRLTPVEYLGSDSFRCTCECGNEVEVRGGNLRHGNVKSCGCWRVETSTAAFTGERNPSWNGGQHISSSGYRYLRRPEHPCADDRGYVAEHRLVVEGLTGRPLLQDETVHHKNGDRLDNRSENLELRSGNHGHGAAVSDLCDWAEEILLLYRPDRLVRTR